MESIVKRFKTLKDNFWEIYPSLVFTAPFKKFYNEDRTLNKSFSSTIMWGISFIIERDSPYYNYPLDTKIKIVFSDFLKQIKTTRVDWYKTNRKKLDNLIESYSDLYLSEVEKSLLTHEKKFKERGVYLESLSYEEGQGDIIEKMLEKTSKIAAEIDNAKKKLLKEKEEATAKGGVLNSATDNGEL